PQAPAALRLAGMNVDPRSTAVLTMELQRGVVGDLTALPQLAAEVATQGTLDGAGRLVHAARRAGVRVVHCTAAFREDRAGSTLNAPLFRAMAKRPGHLLEGSPAAEVVPEIGVEPSDVFSSRYHGLS